MFFYIIFLDLLSCCFLWVGFISLIRGIVSFFANFHELLIASGLLFLSFPFFIWDIIFACYSHMGENKLSFFLAAKKCSMHRFFCLQVQYKTKKTKKTGKLPSPPTHRENTSTLLCHKAITCSPKHDNIDKYL